jgi:hypothetical protein
MKKLELVKKWGLSGQAVRATRQILRDNDCGELRAFAIVAVKRDGTMVRGFEYRSGDIFTLLGAVDNCKDDIHQDVVTL